jgi:hypothetical protein
MAATLRAPRDPPSCTARNDTLRVLSAAAAGSAQRFVNQSTAP